MEIPILVEPVSNNGYPATCDGPLGLEIEAPTRAEAIQQIRELIDRRIAAGAEVVSMEIGGAQHPLAPFAGMLKDDPVRSDRACWSEYVSMITMLGGGLSMTISMVTTSRFCRAKG